MKKLLLGTTAIVGASFVATAAMAAPEIRIGGSMDFQAGVSSQDIEGFSGAPGVNSPTTDRGFGFVTDTEVVIRASDKLDNGLRWAVKVELEGDADNQNTTNDNSDETTLTFSGTWGQLVLGNEDGPADSMNYNAEGELSGLGVSGSRNFRRWVNTTSLDGLWTNGVDIADTSDATKIIYYTPKFAGFQAGVSYSADADDNGRTRAPALGDGSENWWEVGATYDLKLGDVGFGLSAVGSFADAKDDTTEDVFAWAVAAKAELAGFTASVGYGRDDDSEQAVGNGVDNVQGVSAAVKYTTGPYQIGVAYMHNMADVGGADYSADAVTLGAIYAVASGVRLYADTFYYTNDSDGADSANENEAIGVLVGTQVSF